MGGGTIYYILSQNVFLHIIQGYFKSKPFLPFFLSMCIDLNISVMGSDTQNLSLDRF